jgi:FMN-dependent NADH-azoreductase
MNQAVPYLEAILGFMGITDVETTIYVEGLAIGPDAAQNALVAARSRIGALALAA